MKNLARRKRIMQRSMRLGHCICNPKKMQTNAGGLDVATKQAIAIALSVHAHCAPCVKAHVKKAKSMGFTDDEIEEAASMAISFGGGPTMMFYNSVKKG